MIQSTSRFLLLASGVTLLASIAVAQVARRPGGSIDDAAAAQRPGGPGKGGQGGAEATRAFLGLGAAPDKVAAGRGAPVYAQNCAACHGPDARGGIGPNLLYSNQVLGDDHGEKLVSFLHGGRPEKGMPAFASLGDATLKDVTEWLHLQVENYANRGTYQNTNNVMMGDAKKGASYFRANCASCHSVTGDLKGVAVRYRPLELQKEMIFPSREDHPTRMLNARITSPTGSTEGRLKVLDDFTVAVVDKDGLTHAFSRGPNVKVEIHDPLQWHRAFAFRLKDRDMTDLVTYLGTLK
ncbi:MAG TPA: c-type cytochrome [Sphingomicrobium sp.]|nr:c-type cytochrome [Sphingomicrobium sp.]